MSRILSAVASWRDTRLADPRHADRTAALLGAALGISFSVCFVTGLLSHLAQDPTSWFTWPARPAGLYRVTQGLHVITGVASVPLLLAKLWSVFPRLFRWPFADDVLHLVERLTILPLVGGSIFLLVTGVANIELWYPWVFFFPSAHYAVAFVVMGAMVTHLAAKWTTARRALRRTAVPTVDAAGRRGFLGAAGAMSAGLVVATAGQTVWPLRHLAVLAPRRPDIGTQGFPVNKTAREAGVLDAALDPSFTLTIEEGGRVMRTFALDELRSMSGRTATLPIACVEGWSANRHWTGVSVHDLLAAAGARTDRDVSVQSIQRGGRYRSSTLTPSLVADLDTMLALQVDGEDLHPDHGAPLRLIAPNRPGVLQTKWIDRLVIR